MAAVASERMTEPSMSPSPSQLMVRSPSKRASDASVTDSPSSSHADSNDRSPSNSRLVEIQDPTYLRSEEYRQMFRLPPAEVLVQDFNCALQENFLLQGHMYLFANHICFYSNLFGFETKKIISFHEISSVKRAKAAVLFPTAIEIIAGGKKYFFTSFLSRDEAFKIIYDGWLQQGTEAKLITDQQDLKPVVNGQENGNVIVEKAVCSGQVGDITDLVERNEESSTLDDHNTPVDGEIDMLSTSDGLEENGPDDIEIVQATDGSLPEKSLGWVEEESDAPGVPEGYTKVADSKFLVKVEDFFQYLFSDSTIDFQEDFHKKCGDKDFSCSKWSPHEKFGHTRDVSFQHPIKLYFGAKFGICSELQRYRVYRNSYLVVDTSQEITGVPFADYFRVEGLWHVEKTGDNSNPGCTLRVYTNVNFSKSTMFKGKIVQSTIDECRDAYAAWIELAHQVLKQKNLEIQESAVLYSNMIKNNLIRVEESTRIVEPVEVSNESNTSDIHAQLPTPDNVNLLRIDSIRGSCTAATLVAYTFRDSVLRFLSKFKNQSNVSVLLIICLTVVLLMMQMSILVLLSRPQQVHVISQPGFSAINGGSGSLIERQAEFSFIDKQIKHLKEELHFVESMIDKMQNQHGILKLKLQDLELLRRGQK